MPCYLFTLTTLAACGDFTPAIQFASSRRIGLLNKSLPFISDSFFTNNFIRDIGVKEIKETLCKDLLEGNESTHANTIQRARERNQENKTGIHDTNSHRLDQLSQLRGLAQGGRFVRSLGECEGRTTYFSWLKRPRTVDASYV